jgi:hypothetical protein
MLRFSLTWLLSGFVSSCGLFLTINTYVFHLLPFQKNHIDAPLAILLPPTVLHSFGAALGELSVFCMAKTLVKRLDPTTRARLVFYSKSLSERPTLAFFVIYGFACWPAFLFDWAGMVSGLGGVKTSVFLTATALGKVSKGLLLLRAVQTNAAAVESIYPFAVLAFALSTAVAAFRHVKKNNVHKEIKKNNKIICFSIPSFCWPSWAWRTRGN